MRPNMWVRLCMNWLSSVDILRSGHWDGSGDG